MKVLVVDDDGDIRRIAKASFELVGGFETTSAASGPEAIALAKRSPPDVIVMDMMMPEMDGLAAMAELRQTPGLQRIPVVFLTAKVRKNEVAHYGACGARGVIEKPFNPLTLPHELLALLGPLTTEGPDATRTDAARYAQEGQAPDDGEAETSGIIAVQTDSSLAGRYHCVPSPD